MLSELELLELVANISLPTGERKNAAALLVRLKTDAVPQPSTDDAQVQELLKSWSTPAVAAGYAAALGRTGSIGAKDAVAYVHKTLRLRILLAVVVDEGADQLVRLAAAEAILRDHLSSRHWLKSNNFTPERMLVAIKPVEKGKMTTFPWKRVPLSRPPMCLADVWEV